jgi:phenylacetate-CoA ligase
MIYKQFYNIYKLLKKKDYVYNEIVNNPNKIAEKYLFKLKEFSFNNIPYYEKIKNNDTIPILTKDIIKNNFALLKNPNIKNYRINTSGGSTGEPAQFIQDDIYNKFVGYGIKYFYNELLDIDINPLKKVMLWGSEKDLLNWNGDWKRFIKNKIHRINYLNAFLLTNEKLNSFINKMNYIQPEYIRGYATTLYELARFIEKQDKILKFKPLIIISSAETLQDFMRNKIEDVFQCKVYDFYGSREAGAIAGQCKYGKYHFFNFNQYPEFLPYKDSKDTFKLLITTLHNYSMPLIRYEIGDLVIKNKENITCKCGSDLPFVDKIKGRITDNFISTKGEIIHGEYFTHLFYGIKEIKRFQVIQKDYDLIHILIELDDDVKSLFKKEYFETDITKKIKLVMGNNTEIVYCYKKINSTINGKFLYTKSDVYKK